jgi:hypothetical protein
MNDSRGTAGGTGGEVVLLNQKRTFPGASTLPGNGDTINSATNDHYVEALALQRRPRCTWTSHVSD